MSRPPRLAPDRALPEVPYRPGEGVHPSRRPGAEHPHFDRLPIGPWEGEPEHRFAIDCFHAGAFWEAHEVWEAWWHVAPEGTDEREALQALVQTCAAELKRVQQQPRPAALLAEKARARFANCRAERVLGLDVRALAADLARFPEVPIVLHLGT